MTEPKKPNNVIDIATARKNKQKQSIDAFNFDDELRGQVHAFLLHFSEMEGMLASGVADLLIVQNPDMQEEEFVDKLGGHTISVSASIIAYMAAMYCADKESAKEFIDMVHQTAHVMLAENKDL